MFCFGGGLWWGRTYITMHCTFILKVISSYTQINCIHFEKLPNYSSCRSKSLDNLASESFCLSIPLSLYTHDVLNVDPRPIQKRGPDVCERDMICVLYPGVRFVIIYYLSDNIIRVRESIEKNCYEWKPS